MARSEAPRLESIRARIVYETATWQSVELVPLPGAESYVGLGPDLEDALGDPRAVIPTPGPWENCYGPEVTPLDRPYFWQEVRQLHFAFEDNDWPRIKAFYYENGPLGNPWDPIMDPWAFSAAWLGWFQKITILVDALQNGRIGQLRGYFPGGGPPDVRARGYEPFNLTKGMSWLVWRPFQPVSYDIYVEATDDDALLQRRIWQTITEGVTEELGRIQFSPVVENYSRAAAPVVLWGFRPHGALQAGFLQWFLQKLASVEVRVCAAEGCNNPVPPGRRDYCSRTCSGNTRTARYRAGKAKRATSPARKPSPNNKPHMRLARPV